MIVVETCVYRLLDAMAPPAHIIYISSLSFGPDKRHSWQQAEFHFHWGRYRHTLGTGSSPGRMVYYCVLTQHTYALTRGNASGARRPAGSATTLSTQAPYEAGQLQMDSLHCGGR